MHVQSCLTLCDPIDWSPPGSSVHGIFSARILEWISVSSSRGIFSTQGLNSHLLCLLHYRLILYHWATREASDAGNDWRQKEKRVAEDKIVRLYHQLNGHEFEQTLGDSGGQRSLTGYRPWGHQESDTTLQLKSNSNMTMYIKVHWKFTDNIDLISKFSKEYWTSLVAQLVKRLPTMRETQVQSLGREDLLEKELVTHSSILAWKIPWMEKPGRLQFMGSQRVRHNWVTSLSFSYGIYTKINGIYFFN